MPKKHQTSPGPYDILGQAEVTEGDAKVIITEYNNGAKSHSKIHPKRPFYKHSWFYFLIILAFFMLLTVEHYLP